jgi:hypothetical protein
MKYSKTTKENYQSIIDSLDLDDTQKKVLKSTWLDYLLLMNSSAGRGWFSHNYSQIAVIIFSLLIPVIEKSKLNVDIFHLDLTIISVLGLLVAALTTLNRQLGFEEKWRHYRMNAETMRNEGDDFFALAGSYEKFTSHKEAFKLFTTTVTSYKRQEVNTYIEEEKSRKKDNE